MRLTILALAAGVLAGIDGWAVAEEHAAKPIPAGKNVPTHARFAEAHLKFALADVELYRQHTQDPQGVREAAANFIRDVYTRNLLDRPKPSWEELRQTFFKLTAAGSKDPLVISQFGLVLTNVSRVPEACKRLRDALAGFKKSNYPARPRYRAMDRLLGALVKRNRGSEMAPLMSEYRELAVQWALSAADKPDHQPFLAYAMNNIFQAKALIKEQESVCEACCAKAELSPWLREMLLGRLHKSLAWHFRGGGYGDAVTAENAAKFESNLRLATKHFTAAWELKPDWPQAAAEMIAVAMGLGDAKPSPRDWFDRAVAAEFDYMPAYSSMLWALRPRWGGSHEAMQLFGMECVATGRADTEVPFQLIQAFLDMQSELPTGAELWGRPDVYAAVKAACELMEHEPLRADELRAENTHSYTMSLQAAAAVYAKQYADARRLLEQLGDRAKATAFNKLRRKLDDDRPLVFALTGKGGAQVAEALKHVDSIDDPESRLKVFTLLQAAAKLDSDPRALPFFRRWLASAEWERRFAAGERVDLPFTKDNGLWESRVGTWEEADAQNIVGKPARSGQGIIYACRAKFAAPLEIEVDVESIEATQRAPRAGIFVGDCRANVYQGSDEPSGMLFWIDGAHRGAGIARPGEQSWGIDQHLPKPCHLRLRVWRDYFEFYVDGRLFPVQSSTAFQPDGSFALSNTHWSHDGSAVRFSNLHVRKLAVAVPPPESDDAARVRYYTDLIGKPPNDPYARYFRALACYRLGDARQAEADMRQAVQMRGDLVDAAINHGEELATMHENFALARAVFEVVLLAQPDSAKAHRALAWFLATCDEAECRNGSVALTHAARACELAGQSDFQCLAALAAAQAEVGQYDEAVKVAQQAQDLAGHTAKAKIRKMLDQFQARHPYHEPRSKRPE